MGRYGYGYGDDYGGWAPYVSVAQRRRNALKEMESLKKKGVDIQPIKIDGRKIAKSFWGAAWCDHLESLSDFANRLPRGRTYVRNGSVCHLAISKGKIEAKVSGSELYDVEISIKTLSPAIWKTIKAQCGGQISTLLELLQGRLSDHVMEVVTDQKAGMFPLAKEITLECSCPDYATMCKHVAAVLYGIGSRLDSKPEMLFLLRGVSHEELIDADAETAVNAATSRGNSKRLATANLGDVFGIELDTAGSPESPRSSQPKRKAKKAASVNENKTAAKKVSRKSVALSTLKTQKKVKKPSVVKRRKSAAS